MKLSFVLLLPCFVSTAAFQAARPITKQSSTSLGIVPGDKEDVVDKVKRFFKNTKEDKSFDAVVKKQFPKALDNKALQTSVVKILADKGFTGANTLLATSLCCDELARRLEDDFVAIYGDNFNLGGLAGFPFAGNTGFGAMAAVSIDMLLANPKALLALVTNLRIAFSLLPPISAHSRRWILSHCLRTSRRYFQRRRCRKG